MNCAKIQEIIITDYIDNRLAGKQKMFIDNHLEHCSACGDFFLNVKQVTWPFNKAYQLAPDRALWAQIKQSIEEKEHVLVNNPVADFWERLRAAVHIPRPAFALATVLTMVFMIGTIGQFFISPPALPNNSGRDQVEYISSLIEEPAVDINKEPQTPIEKYFL